MTKETIIGLSLFVASFGALVVGIIWRAEQIGLMIR